jgi:hypothetical protein
MYKTGDRVVFTATKHSDHPTPRAEDLEPEPHGEGYSYAVRKYWVVAGINPDGSVKVLTRRGKERMVAASDPRLRPARWWESLLMSSRFPRLDGHGESPDQASRLKASA